jgi:hypothetical protein
MYLCIDKKFNVVHEFTLLHNAMNLAVAVKLCGVEFFIVINLISNFLKKIIKITLSLSFIYQKVYR